MNGVGKFIGTAASIGVGFAAIAVDNIVKERGPETIIEPASAAYETVHAHIAPFAATATSQAALLVDRIGQRLGAESRLSADMTEAGAPLTPESASNPEASETADARGTSETGGTEAEAAVETEIADASDPTRFAQCDPSGGASDAAVLGDRVSLRFFETSSLTAPGGPDGSTSENIVFERLDLAGTYEVGANGAVSLPAIGHVDVIGRDLACIEDIVRLAARDRLRLDGTVSAAFAYRPPVLVRGSVRSPGSHAYSPGLTVKRILAQAGAVDTGSTLSPQQRAALHARETELQVQDAGLIVEKARIQATLSNDLSLSEHIPSVDLVADVLGSERIESERRLLLSDLAAESVNQERMQARIGDLTSRVEAAREHLAVVEAQLDQHTVRSDELSSLLERGIIAEDKVEEARLRQMTSQRLVLERRDALMQLEAELRLAQSELDLRDVERTKLLIGQARDIATQRTALHEQIRTVYAQLGADEGDEAQTYLVTIERPERDHVDRFSAGPETTVMPGDLVTVENAISDGTRDAVPTSAPGRDREAIEMASREWLKQIAVLR